MLSVVNFCSLFTSVRVVGSLVSFLHERVLHSLQAYSEVLCLESLLLADVDNSRNEAAHDKSDLPVCELDDHVPATPFF